MKERTPRTTGKRPRAARPWPARGLALLMMLLIVVAGVCVRYAGVLAAVAPGCAARNGGMEDLFVNGIAVGWDNNSYGGAEVTFSREDEKPHSGQSAQRIHLERVNQGAAQLRLLGISVRAAQP